MILPFLRELIITGLIIIFLVTLLPSLLPLPQDVSSMFYSLSKKVNFACEPGHYSEFWDFKLPKGYSIIQIYGSGDCMNNLEILNQTGCFYPLRKEYERCADRYCLCLFQRAAGTSAPSENIVALTIEEKDFMSNRIQACVDLKPNQIEKGTMICLPIDCKSTTIPIRLTNGTGNLIDSINALDKDFTVRYMEFARSNSPNIHMFIIRR